MKQISIKELLDAGVHFGHRTNRWNPKMSEFIFGHRNGIHIIDLQQTLVFFNDALKTVEDFAKEGKNILFVGTKRQASDIVEKYASDNPNNGSSYLPNNLKFLSSTLIESSSVDVSERILLSVRLDIVILSLCGCISKPIKSGSVHENRAIANDSPNIQILFILCFIYDKTASSSKISS